MKSINLLKINFRSYVPKNCGFMDEGWGNDSIYCTDTLEKKEIDNLLSHHIWMLLSHHIWMTEITKYRFLSSEKCTIKPSFMHCIYSKGNIIEYSRNGKTYRYQEWDCGYDLYN